MISEQTIRSSLDSSKKHDPLFATNESEKKADDTVMLIDKPDDQISIASDDT